MTATSACDESVLRFGHGQAQLGVLCRAAHWPEAAQALVRTPAQDLADCAVLCINAGLTHHIGPHRLHVQLARALAAQGLASLRLDLSGIGDSPARADHLPIVQLVQREPREAMDALAALGLRRFILLGLCSGAYSAWHVACADVRVLGAVLLNPEDLARGGAIDASAWRARYWSRSLWRVQAWRNLLRGRVNYRRLWAALVHPGQPAAPQAAAPAAAAQYGLPGLRAELLQALQARALRLLFITCSDDVSHQYLNALLDDDALRQLSGLQRQSFAECDHLFTRLADQRRLLDFLVPWLLDAAAAPSSAARRST